ncbi:GAF domain-containing protein [Sulfitobacter sp. JB4-11]|uniref:GAF domain-containing protein n=1 Tax=Sulfitobacter rhodophyticola TaxID=3238304 RepID=UPI00351582F9
MRGDIMSDTAQSVETLTKREAEVAAAYADGASYKVIARDLGISPTTVRSHLRTVYGKLNVTSKIALAQALADPDAKTAQSQDAAELTADLALELDEAMRRERAMTGVLRIINDSSGNLDEVIDEVLEQALEICEAEFGILMEHHGDYVFTEMRSSNITTPFANWLAEQGAFNPGVNTAVGRAARSLKPVSIVDVNSEDVPYDDNPLRFATVKFGHARSLAAIPMTSGGRLIGVFSVYRTRVHPFNDRALELAQAFADQAAIAIENSLHISEMEGRLERSTASREILDAISTSSDDEAPVFDAILRNAARLCNAPMARLELADNARQNHYCAAAWGDEMRSFKVGEAMPLDQPNDLPTAIREGVVRHIHDLSKTELYLSGNPTRVRMVEEEGYRTYLCVPLIAAGTSIGAIVLSRREVAPFSDESIALVENLAKQAVIAIENVRRFRELRDRLKREAATHEILQVINQNRDDAMPVFDAILKKAIELCGASSGALTLGAKGEDHQRMAVSYGVSQVTLDVYARGEVSMNPDISMAAKAILTGEVVHVADMADTDGYRSGVSHYTSVVDDTGIRTNLFVPLMTPEGGEGVLVLFRKEVKPYKPDEIALVETFATQASIALENVRQFRELQARTSEVQALNASLEAKVNNQVVEIERMGRLKRFLPPAVADTIVSSGSEQMLQSHRALLGVLFCDIRGFTAFCETAEPEETIEVLQTYHEEMGKLINQHGAGVDLRMGDGVMVLFNDPIPCDDPAGDAVRLAIEMRTRMAELCAGWKRLGHRLGFGVGISLGYATVGLVGHEGRFDYTASGTAINLASRLCDEAVDGEILLSARAGIAVEDAFEVETRGELSLKGIREPIEVFRFVNET